METPLNHLCSICNQIKYRFHKYQNKTRDRGHSWVGRWDYDFPEGYKRIATFRHHHDLAALQTSAQEGCHLCSLFSFGLTYNKIRMIGDSRPYRIRVVYGIDDDEGDERLQVRYGGWRADFDTIPLPPRRCSELEHPLPLRSLCRLSAAEWLQVYPDKWTGPANLSIRCPAYTRPQALESFYYMRHRVLFVAASFKKSEQEQETQCIVKPSRTPYVADYPGLSYAVGDVGSPS
jgi:hypothetical protein